MRKWNGYQRTMNGLGPIYQVLLKGDAIKLNPNYKMIPFGHIASAIFLLDQKIDVEEYMNHDTQ